MLVNFLCYLYLWQLLRLTSIQSRSPLNTFLVFSCHLTLYNIQIPQCLHVYVPLTIHTKILKLFPTADCLPVTSRLNLKVNHTSPPCPLCRYFSKWPFNVHYIDTSQNDHFKVTTTMIVRLLKTLYLDILCNRLST